MVTRHLSVRLEAETFERLEARSQQVGQPISQLARTLLEEGLRMQAHPGIVFRDGPTGRRPGPVGGPDVWEVARVFKGVEGVGEARLRETAELTGLRPEQVRTAFRYYADRAAEIDDWLRRVDAEADRAGAAWQREQALLEQ